MVAITSRNEHQQRVVDHRLLQIVAERHDDPYGGGMNVRFVRV